MTPTDVLKDAFGRVLEATERVVDGLTEDQLAQRPGPDANTIAWLVWHIARGQDAQIADVAGTEQVWTSQGFVDRFALPLDPQAHGYGMTSDEVARVRASADLLVDYLRTTHTATIAYLDTLTEEDLDRVVDERWDPPVTLGVRLVSIVDDDLQHVGQAAYVRGLLF
ncbi:mycothiol transferase [Nocardioides sp. AN3]